MPMPGNGPQIIPDNAVNKQALNPCAGIKQLDVFDFDGYKYRTERFLMGFKPRLYVSHCVPHPKNISMPGNDVPNAHDASRLSNDNLEW